jgi:hypothetical protein
MMKDFKGSPNYLKKHCIPSSEVHTRNLRSVSSNNLAVIRPNTNIMKISFAYSSAILWNKLPCMQVQVYLNQNALHILKTFQIKTLRK